MGIYVWGTGCGVSDLVDKGFGAERITAFVDSAPQGDIFMGLPVLKPEALNIDDCELMIVTTRHGEAVAKRCAELGIEAEKLLFTKNNFELADKNKKCSIAQKLLGNELLTKIIPENYLVRKAAGAVNSVLSRDELEGDYVRSATLELLCKRLADVPGAVAELGVYKGSFARLINKLLPDRRLYLFDSFHGFAESAGASDSMQAAHENTSVERVLSLMPYPEQVEIRAGFFPETAKDLEERFCLVSLDVDYYQTTLDGLEYFWPRLSKGGFIMLHDWGNTALPGVADALETYEQLVAQKLAAVPLCDLNNSLVLVKT